METPLTPHPGSGEHEDRLRAEFARKHLLYEVSNVIHSTLDQQTALELILGEAVRMTNAFSGSVVLINPNTNFLEILASHGLPERARELRLKVGEGITGWVAQTGNPARVGNVAADSRYVMVGGDVRSELAVPLIVGDELRGVINVDSDRADAFTEEDEHLLQEFSLQAAKVIYNTWLHERAQNKARQFETLVTVGQTINSALNLDDALQRITREACLLMNVKMCSLLLVDDDSEWLELRASYGAGEAYLSRTRLSVAESLLGRVVRRQRAVQEENVQTSSRFQRMEVARKEGLVSLLSVPLVYEQHAIGTLNVYTGHIHHFSNEEIQLLKALADLSALAIQKARLYERVVDTEEQLRQNEQLSTIGLLAAEVAHEIRNPLTVMKMLFHSLDLKFPEGDPRNEDAKVMGEKMDHLNKIVEQILVFARSAEPVFGSVNVNQAIGDLGLLTRHKLNQHHIALVQDLHPYAPLAKADATQLSQAMLNLTLNAVDAMPEGGTLTISTRPMRIPLKGPANWVSIKFKDTGYGMTEEQQQRIFGPILSTTKASGTGLGLTIVHRIIDGHNGKVKIKSRPGEGTTVRILLPAT